MSGIKIKYPSNNAQVAGEVDIETLVAILAANPEFRAALKAYFDTLYVAIT